MDGADKYAALPDGTLIGWRYLYTCKECRSRYLEDVHPSRQDWPICHECLTGGRGGPARVYREGLTTESN